MALELFRLDFPDRESVASSIWSWMVQRSGRAPILDRSPDQLVFLDFLCNIQMYVVGFAKRWVDIV